MQLDLVAQFLNLQLREKKELRKNNYLQLFKEFLKYYDQKKLDITKVIEENDYVLG